MKKYIITLNLIFLFFSNAFAEKIEISRCSTDGKFNKETFIDRKFVIDEERNVVSFVSIYQDVYLKKEREKYISENKPDIANQLTKIYTTSHPIKYLGTEFVEAVEKNPVRDGDWGYIISLKNKTVEIVGGITQPPTIWKCK